MCHKHLHGTLYAPGAVLSVITFNNPHEVGTTIFTLQMRITEKSLPKVTQRVSGRARIPGAAWKLSLCS